MLAVDRIMQATTGERDAVMKALTGIRWNVLLCQLMVAPSSLR